MVKRRNRSHEMAWSERTSLCPFTIREARDDDAPDVIALVERCFSDYPGCVMDLPGLDADLPRVASHFSALGGRFWVAEAADDNPSASATAARILGCIGYLPLPTPGHFELKRLYVHPRARRMGLASRLAALVEEAVRDLGGNRILLWSDTRFREAHAFYRARGYRASGRTRELHDPSRTTEYEFTKGLDSQDPVS